MGAEAKTSKPRAKNGKGSNEIKVLLNRTS